MRNNNPPRSKTAKGSRGYKVTNWRAYNCSLKKRGNIVFWISSVSISDWYYTGKTQRGSQYKYSPECIELCCILRKVYRLGLRQTEGFIRSVFTMMKLDIDIPDYTVICRRSKTLKVSGIISRKRSTGCLHLVMDSTGLKVYGEGEWKVRQHGYSKHRTWRKLHLAVDPQDNLIHWAEMTTNAVDDAAMVDPLVESIGNRMRYLGGDGAYDKKKVYELLEKEGIKPIIPPRKNARIGKHGNTHGRAKPRDVAIRYIRKHGRKKWKKEHSYHKRSLAETSMFRFKTILGDRLQSRTFERQRIEVLLSCKILNKLTRCGMPISVKIQ